RSSRYPRLADPHRAESSLEDHVSGSVLGDDPRMPVPAKSRTVLEKVDEIFGLLLRRCLRVGDEQIRFIINLHDVCSSTSICTRYFSAAAIAAYSSRPVETLGGIPCARRSPSATEHA